MGASGQEIDELFQALKRVEDNRQTTLASLPKSTRQEIAAAHLGINAEPHHGEPHLTTRPNPYKLESLKDGKIVRSTADKVLYPKHVWSPSGGWYSRPANWKANTAIMGAVIIGLCGVALSVSASREERYGKMPRSDRFYPSRWWSREIREAEARSKA